MVQRSSRYEGACLRMARHVMMSVLTLLADKSPDAVNLWIGDEKSVTSIHSGAL